MRPPLVLLALLAPIALPAVSAQAAPFAAPVLAGDPDVRTTLQNLVASAGYVDANGNKLPDAVQPDEAVYLDLDNTGAVSFGDLRLAGFFTYPAGTGVDYTNRDFGRRLEPMVGWFATQGASWFFDTDGSRTLTAGDVRLTGQAGNKVRAGDPDLGQALTPSQETTTQSIRLGWSDANANRQRDVGEPVYLDLNVDRQVGAGELRLRTASLGADDEATRTELAGAVQRLEADNQRLQARLTQAQAEQQQGETLLRQQQQAETQALRAELAQAKAAAAGAGTWPTLLAVLALAGVGGAIYYARKLHEERRGPAA